MDETKTQGFFRFRIQPLDIIVSEDVDGFHIDLGADTPIEDVSPSLPCRASPFRASRHLMIQRMCRIQLRQGL
jgi:hypothetical protein